MKDFYRIFFLMGLVLLISTGPALAEAGSEKKIEAFLKQEQIFIDPKEIYLRIDEGEIRGIQAVVSRILSPSEAEEYKKVFPERFAGKTIFSIQSTYEFDIWEEISAAHGVNIDRGEAVPKKTVTFRVLKQIYFDNSGKRIEENISPTSYYRPLFSPQENNSQSASYPEEEAIYQMVENILQGEKRDHFLRY